MKVAIFGFGNVGKNIAQLMAEAGQTVIIGARTAQKGQTYPVLTFQQAAKQAEAVVLALPYTVAQDVIKDLSASLQGKIVVDATNPLDEAWNPILLGEENSAGEETQKHLPNSKVVKAFNTIFADIMNPKERKPFTQPIAAFIASDHAQAKDWITTVMSHSAFNVVDTGALKMARYLEAMANLNIQIAVAQQGGTKAGFIYQQV